LPLVIFDIFFYYKCLEGDWHFEHNPVTRYARWFRGNRSYSDAIHTNSIRQDPGCAAATTPQILTWFSEYCKLVNSNSPQKVFHDERVISPALSQSCNWRINPNKEPKKARHVHRSGLFSLSQLRTHSIPWNHACPCHTLV